MIALWQVVVVAFQWWWYLYAFDRGISYFFYSQWLAPLYLIQSPGALQQLWTRFLCAWESGALTADLRQESEMAHLPLCQFVERWELTYIDVYFWGWIDSHDGQLYRDCLQLFPDLRGSTAFINAYRRCLAPQEHLKMRPFAISALLSTTSI